MKVNVLGTEYDIEFLTEKDKTMIAVCCVGYTDFSVKKIRVLKEEYDDTKFEDLTLSTNNTLRHELIHAFLYECGIDYKMMFHNEECVDFFAVQSPKLFKLFKGLNIHEV